MTIKQLAENGANVLHDRCIKLAEKYQIKIISQKVLKGKNG